MASVTIHNVSHVAVSLSPVPENGILLPLSFFDTYWIFMPPVQRLLLFPASPDVHSLKSSLSATLSRFYPLAGQLTYLPATGQVAVACSPDDLVTFIEAESDGDLTRLASDNIHDVGEFLRLVPELDIRVLPAPTMAIQVTRFEGGGVSVGVSVHHAVVDGRGLWQFVEAWAASSRSGEQALTGVSPVHDRAVIRHHPHAAEIASRILKEISPNLPITTSPEMNLKGRFELMRRTFTLSPGMIQALKQRVKNSSMQMEPNNGGLQASTFTVVSALSWISFTKAKGMKDNEETLLLFLMDCRAHLKPPLADSYSGNCVKPCFVKAKVLEVVGKDGLRRACLKIKEEIDENRKDHVLRGCEDWVAETIKYVKSMRMVAVSGSPSFQAYETDFGVGRPSRTELVSMNRDGQVVFVCGREKRGVQMSVALAASDMEKFAIEFMRGFTS